MNQEFDEIVKDSMAWFVEEVDVPAGIAAQARDQVRRQRRARMGWIASGTAVVAAVAVAVGTLGTGGAGSGPQHTAAKGGTTPAVGHGVTVQTTSVVISRVKRALARAATGSPVAFTRETSQGSRLVMFIPHVGPAELPSSAVTESWSRGALSNSEYLSRAGNVLFSQQTDNSSGKSVQTMANYSHRVWWNGTYDAPSATQPQAACTLGDTQLSVAQWTREVKKLLSCGAAFAGSQQIDGVKTVKINLSSTYKNACAASNYQNKCTPVPVGWRGTLWANASTFLPVRLTAKGQHFGFQIDFRWLAPTPANLALLNPKIPAGFRHV
jgi:hypothetical protein